MERFPPDAVSRQLVPSINISLAQMRLIFLGTLFRKRERERDAARKQVGEHRRKPGGGKRGRGKRAEIKLIM